MQYPKILKDPELNLSLEKNGFVKIPFLTPNEVGELLKGFKQLGEMPDRFYATTHTPDSKMRKSVNALIHKVLKRAFTEILHDEADPLGGAFLNKPSGNSGILPLHQDWNIVDERVNRSFNIWIPLIDVDEKNGAVKVLPASHNKKYTVRGVNIDSELMEIQQQVSQHLQLMEMNGGEALITDHALWHASGVNSTENARPAIVIGCVSKGVEIKYFYKENNDVVEYNAPSDFYLYGNPMAGPQGLKKVGITGHTVQQMAYKEFSKLLLGKEESVPDKTGFWSKIKEIFGQ